MKALGIDFGTTNSAVAYYDTASKKLLTSDYEGTLLYFKEIFNHPPAIGNAAIAEYIDNGMEGRFIKSLKSLLPFSLFKFTNIAGKRYAAEDLVAIVLKHYLEKGIKMSGQVPDVVVVGRPVNFSASSEKDTLAQERLEKAAHKAGIKEVRFQYEPIAAALTYENSLEKEEVVLVCDLGGGTSDFTLMRLNPARSSQKDRKKDILGTSGIKVGGDDFDSAIAWHKIIPQLGYGLEYDSTGKGKMLPISPSSYLEFCKWERHILLNTPMRLKELSDYYRWTGSQKIKTFMEIIQRNLGYSLFQSIEKAKIDLSQKDTTELSYQNEEIQIQAEISLAEFDSYITPLLKKIEENMDELLSEVHLETSEIDSIFLTGGSSLVRPVRNLFSRKFGQEKIKESDSFVSVVKGLALSSTSLG